jgi:hypothetical protein
MHTNTVENAARRFLKLHGLRTTQFISNPSEFSFFIPPNEDDDDGLWLEAGYQLCSYNIPENVSYVVFFGCVFLVLCFFFVFVLLLLFIYSFLYHIYFFMFFFFFPFFPFFHSWLSVFSYLYLHLFIHVFRFFFPLC